MNIPEKDIETGMYIYPGSKTGEYVEAKTIPEKYWQKIKIITDSEESKEQILAAIEYIHYLENINSDFMPVNSLMHLYLHPELVIIDKNFTYE